MGSTVEQSEVYANTLASLQNPHKSMTKLPPNEGKWRESIHVKEKPVTGPSAAEILFSSLILFFLTWIWLSLHMKEITAAPPSARPPSSRSAAFVIAKTEEFN